MKTMKDYCSLNESMWVREKWLVVKVKNKYAL